MAATAHRLSGIDTAARTATCTACGSVRITSKGEGKWRCATKDASKKKAWRKANPDKVKADHLRAMAKRATGVRAPHSIDDHDMLTLTGVCPEDGAVDIRRHGRGWVCSTQQYCRCDTELLWLLAPNGSELSIDLCTDCCKVWANWLVNQGLIEPVIDLLKDFGSDSNRIDWAKALSELGELEAA